MIRGLSKIESFISNVGPKTINLAFLADAGFNIPNTYFITNDQIASGEYKHITSSEISKIFRDSKFIIRSSALIEDSSS
ncbi:MAG: hypothetical protein Q9M91_03340 [Candidatus Dojkabacteria bacterium]|nr:hypothetical protein [Candidatus Dojkabacteria bacterium]MDQ7020858.1 hypothetical protein [Candidatus Dojkabacteria bacterium]